MLQAVLLGGVFVVAAVLVGSVAVATLSVFFI
jgi:hypothetical protein